MGSIVTEVEIADRPEEVFAYATDPAKFPEWQQNVTGGHMDGKEAAVGQICHTTRRIGGRERDVSSEVIRMEPPRTWGVRGIDGPIRATVNVTVEPIDDGLRSRVTIDLDFTGHGIGKVLVPLVVRPQSRKEMQRNMERLKARLEPTT